MAFSVAEQRGDWRNKTAKGSVVVFKCRYPEIPRPSSLETNGTETAWSFQISTLT